MYAVVTRLDGGATIHTCRWYTPGDADAKRSEEGIVSVMPNRVPSPAASMARRPGPPSTLATRRWTERERRRTPWS